MDLVTLLQKAGVGKGLEKKANEVMHPENTGYGAEFIPSEVFASQVYDLVPQRARLLPLLPGSHGNALPKTYTAPVVGLSIDDLLFQGKGEWTTGDPSATENDHGISRAQTMNVTLNQKSFICEVRISDGQLRYNAANTEAYVKEQIAKAMGYTVDYAIINGDATSAGTGNVNSDDQAAATTFSASGGSLHASLILDNGIRKLAITNGYTVNVGTLAAEDYSALLGVLGEYGERPEDCLFIQPVKVTTKMRTLDEFELGTNSAEKATIQKGIIPTPYGVDVLQHRAVKLTEADGKRSGVTLSNNTLGQILAIYKPAIQYGFGQEFLLEVERVTGYGWRLVATFDFAFSIVDGGASLENPTVAAGINVTV